MNHSKKMIFKIALNFVPLLTLVFVCEVNANLALPPTNQNLTARTKIAFKPNGPVSTKFVKEIAKDQEQTVLNDVKQTPDEGYIAVGHTRINSDPLDDALIIKFDKDGVIEWKKTLDTYVGATTTYDYFYEVEVDTSGNYIVLGQGLLQYTFSGTYTNVKRWLLKFDPNGNLITHKAFYNVNTGPDIGNIALTSNGLLIVNGDSNSSDPYFAKINPNTMSIIWEKVYIPSGSNKPERLYDVIQTNDGNYLGVGYRDDSYDQVLVIKVNDSGNIIFSKTVDSPIPLYNLSGSSVVELDNGDLFIVGNIWIQSPSQIHAIALMLDSDGNLLWIKQYQSDSGNSKFTSVTQIKPDFLMVTGYANAETMVAKMDLAGNILSTKTYLFDAAGAGSSVGKTIDGGAMIGGARALIKVDENGNAGEDCAQAPEITWTVTVPDSQEIIMSYTVLSPSQFNNGTFTKQPNVTQEDVIIYEDNVCGDL